MKVLFVIRNYKTNDGPTEIIVESISNNLKKEYVEVDFLTLDSRSKDSNIYVVPKKSSLFSSIKSKFLHRFLKYPYEIIYSKSLANSICKLHSKNNYDYIIPVIGSIVTLVACKLAFKRNSISYVPYFTDIVDPSKFKLEKRCLKTSHKIIENVSHQTAFLNKYPSLQTRTLFCEWPSLYCYENPIDLNDNSVVYTGSFYKNVRNESNIINLAKNNQSFFFYLVGSNVSNKNIPKNISIIKKCELKEVNRYITSAAFLLNIENNNSNQLPSKLINYICSKKKIFNLKSTDKNISEDYLIKTNSSFCNITENTDLKEVVFIKNEKEIEIDDFDPKKISQLILDFLIK